MPRWLEEVCDMLAMAGVWALFFVVVFWLPQYLIPLIR